MLYGAPNVQRLQRGRKGFWMDARLGVCLWLLERGGVVGVDLQVREVVVSKVVMLVTWVERVVGLPGRPRRLPRSHL